MKKLNLLFILLLTATCCLALPAQVQSFRQVGTSTKNTIGLGWRPNFLNTHSLPSADRVAGYKIYRKIGSGSFTFIATLADRYYSSFTDEGLTPGTTYIYEVKAYNFSGGLSVSSTSVNATTLTGDFLLSFPGAQGYGAKSVGGRGGTVIHVTNLNKSGTGSLKAAIDASGLRIIVFDVAGTIDYSASVDYNTTLTVVNPYCTIAAHTAPGAGINLKGAFISVGTHDVIVRGMRVRPGEVSPFSNTERPDGFKVSNEFATADVYNVIYDHCSGSLGKDEMFSLWQNPPYKISGSTYTIDTNAAKKQLRDITYQWCISAEGMVPYPKVSGTTGGFGFLIGMRIQNVTSHHNLLVSNRYRNAQVKADTKVEWINNVVYNAN